MDTDTRNDAKAIGRMNASQVFPRITLLVGLALQTSLACAGEVPHFVVAAKVSLGKVSGRIDHLAYDPARKLLYVAELGNDSVGIVDLKSQRLLRTVSGFDEPQGIGYEPATDSVYVANGGDGSVRILRGEDFVPITQIELGADADNVRVDPAARRVYVGHGNGALAVIDAVSHKRIADIALKGHPESFQLDPAGPRIYVNVPDAGVIQVATRDTNASIAIWPTAALRANYPLAVDMPNHLLLAVFRQPARLVAFDLGTGSPLTGVDACGDADDIFVDSKRSRVFVICGDGTVDTYASANKTFTRVAQFEISRGSRTGLFLPEIDRLVVAVRARDGETAAVWLLRPASTAADSGANSPENTQPTGAILMVCEHGNVKSLMAANYFNQMAQARQLPFHAISRGTAPDSTTVPPAIVAGLRTDGFDVSDFHPTAIAAADVASADRVILISTQLPSNLSGATMKTENWADVPPASVNYGAAREALKNHVNALLDQLSARQPR
jgi:DNA-binding beta-propeller fold protein YncE/protein-tyrosine-phosphatase